MECLFQITRSFDKDLQRIDPAARAKIVEEINRLAQWFRDDDERFGRRIHKLAGIRPPEGSSLYSFRIDQRRRAIATFDRDPLFDQVIVTLFRLVPHDRLSRTYASVMESLYQSVDAGVAELPEEALGGSD